MLKRKEEDIMMDQVVIRVYEVVGNGLCVASEDGQKVHDQIARTLREGKKILLSFLNVEMLTSAFLNAAIGQLYGEFPEAQIKANLSVTDMEPDDLELLKKGRYGQRLLQGSSTVSAHPADRDGG